MLISRQRACHRCLLDISTLSKSKRGSCHKHSKSNWRSFNIRTHRNLIMESKKILSWLCGSSHLKFYHNYGVQQNRKRMEMGTVLGEPSFFKENVTSPLMYDSSRRKKNLLKRLAIHWFNRLQTKQARLLTLRWGIVSLNKNSLSWDWLWSGIWC